MIKGEAEGRPEGTSELTAASFMDGHTLAETLLPILLAITPPLTSAYGPNWCGIIEKITAYLRLVLQSLPPVLNKSALQKSHVDFCEVTSVEIVTLLRDNQTDSIGPIVKICRAIEQVVAASASRWPGEKGDLFWQEIAVFFEGLEVKAVEKHHLQLAEIVEERTAKIQETNNQLECEVQIRRQTEHELLELAGKLKSSNDELEQFAHVASHDLKEPLTLILAFGERLLRKYGSILDKRGLAYATSLVKAAKQMNGLVDDLLIMAQVSTVACSFEKIDLTELVHDVVQSLEEIIARSGGQVCVSPLGSLGGDPCQLRQLFQNIIVNALKYRQSATPPVVVVKRCPGRSDLCEILVEDNGIGFDPLLVDQIFRPFSRLHSNEKFDGTGIGLATCRKIVVRHGGEITAKSVPGVGSTFIVRIPATLVGEATVQEK